MNDFLPFQPSTATLTFDASATIDAAKALLKLNDYVVLKAKSYRAAQRRQAIAESNAQHDREDAEHTQRWAETTLHNEIRDLQARCTFLYGMARAKGATVDELRGGWKVTGVNIPIERTQTLQCHCGIHPYIIHDRDSRPITRFVCPEHGLVDAR